MSVERLLASIEREFTARVKEADAEYRAAVDEAVANLKKVQCRAAEIQKAKRKAADRWRVLNKKAALSNGSMDQAITISKEIDQFSGTVPVVHFSAQEGRA